MKAHLKFFVSRRLTRDMHVILEKGWILWITVDNLWYNNFLKCQSLSVRTCNSFQSHLVHLHFDRSEITNQVTNNNLWGMGLLRRSCHNNLLTKNQGISWMFFPILWGQFPCCSGYGTKRVLSICRMILTGKDFFYNFIKNHLLWRLWAISVKRWKPVWIRACLLCYLHCTNLHPYLYGAPKGNHVYMYMTSISKTLQKGNHLHMYM